MVVICRYSRCTVYCLHMYVCVRGCEHTVCSSVCMEYSKFRQTAEPIASNMWTWVTQRSATFYILPCENYELPKLHKKIFHLYLSIYKKQRRQILRIVIFNDTFWEDFESLIIHIFNIKKLKTFELSNCKKYKYMKILLFTFIQSFVKYKTLIWCLILKLHFYIFFSKRESIQNSTNLKE